MKRITYLKTLLVGLCAMVATSAWGLDVTETYDFGAFITANGAPALTTHGDAIVQSGTSEKVGQVYLINNLSNNGQTLDLNGRFAVDYASNAGSQIRFMWRSSSNNYQHGLAGNWNSKGTADPQGAARFSVLNLKAGDKITFTYAKQSGRAADPYTCAADIVSYLDGEEEQKLGVDAALSSGTEYTMTADGNLDLYFTNNNFAISKIIIKTTGEENVTKPSITITGVSGTSRYVTLSSGESNIGSAVTTYYTTDGQTPTSSSNVYSEPILVNGGTVKAISISNNGTASEVASLEIPSNTIKLNSPSLIISSLEKESDNYIAKFGVSCDNSSILGAPVATITATFDGTDVSTAITAGNFVPSKVGTLTITASATGYDDSSSSMIVADKYVQTWQSLDYSSLVGDAVQEVLGTDWTLLDGHGRWANWNKDKDGTYNFYQQSGALDSITIDNNIFMRNVVVIAEGMGLGRNVAAEAIYVKNTAAGDIVKFEIYNGYGNDINKGTNTYISYAISDGVNRPSMSSSYGALLVQAAIYRPATTTATIGDNGYATFASPYNVKLPSDVTAYTAKVSGDHVNFTPVESGEIPANTGVLLEGTAGEITLDVVATATALGTNDFKVNTSGATFAVAENTTYFAMVKDSDPLKFGTVDPSKVAIPANKAYLAVVGNSEARLTVTFDGETTAIKSIENAETSNAIYNLNGQRVEKAQKGLYIVNGKKTIVK